MALGGTSAAVITLAILNMKILRAHQSMSKILATI